MSAKSSQSHRPYTIIVEGNIGSGKTTFLSNFAAKVDADIEILSEPVNKWQNVKGHNLLQLMYEDPNRWSLAFQSYAQLTMMRNHLFKTTKSVKMMERSIYSGRHCFIENLYQAGKLPSSEYGVLNEWFQYLTSLEDRDKSRFDLGVDLVVYLRTEPEVAWQRVKERARSEEKVIPLEYVRDLHNLHEKWLMNSVSERGSKVPAKVIVIDANQDIFKMPEAFNNEINEIKDLMKLKKAQKSIQSPTKRVLGEMNRVPV